MADINEIFNSLIKEFKDQSQKNLDYMQGKLMHIRVGRADPNLVSDLLVLYYDEHVKLKQIAQIQVPEPQKLCIKPFEKQSVNAICKAINEIKLDVDVVADADKVILTMRPLTEENRKETCKQVKAVGDEAKQEVRYHRRDVLQKWKKVENKSDDLDQEFEANIDKSLKFYNKLIDEIIAKKEAEIMSMKGRG